MPGAGKTTYLKKVLERKDICSYKRNNIVDNVVKYLSFFVLPLGVIVEFKKIYPLIERSDKESIRRTLYIILFNNYQYILRKILSMIVFIKRKDMYIDEGFVYNVLRMYTFANQEQRNYISLNIDKYISRKTVCIYLTCDANIALQRYLDREGEVGLKIISKWGFGNLSAIDVWLQLDHMIKSILESPNVILEKSINSD